MAELVARGTLHPHIANLTPYEHVYGHQEQAMEAISRGRTTLVATGTGSGKTECFLYPIISHCLRLRAQGAPAGIVAVLVYPMNALAEDQLGRLRALPGHEIPARLPDARSAAMPANQAEASLLEMLVRAGFSAPEAQRRIDLGMPLGATTPDFFYDDPGDRYEGICIYVDGLGAGSHGTVEAQRRDARIRAHLRDEGYEVIAIAASDLSDRGAIARHLARLARVLDGKERAREIRDDTWWFEDE